MCTEINDEFDKLHGSALSDAATRAELLFARNLRRLRSEANLSQEALGELTGSSKGRISEYERGARTCGIGMLGRLAEALNVTIAAFFEEIESEKPRRKSRK